MTLEILAVFIQPKLHTGWCGYLGFGKSLVLPQFLTPLKNPNRILHLDSQGPELISETPARKSSEEKCNVFPFTLNPSGALGFSGTRTHLLMGAPLSCLSLCISFCALPPEGQPSRERGPETASLHRPTVPKMPFLMGGGLAFGCKWSVLHRTPEWLRETQPDVTR